MNIQDNIQDNKIISCYQYEFDGARFHKIIISPKKTEKRHDELSIETHDYSKELQKIPEDRALKTVETDMLNSITGYTTKKVQGKAYTKNTCGLDLKKITDLIFKNKHLNIKNN